MTIFNVVVVIALLVIVAQLAFITNALRTIVEGIRAMRADMKNKDTRA